MNEANLPAVPTQLQTPRLLLTAPRSQDAPAIYAAVQASLPELKEWLVWAHKPFDLLQTADNLAQATEAYLDRSNLRMLIWTPDGKECVGSTGFHSLSWDVPKAEIGYWIATQHVGKGYATEIASALTRFGLEVLGFRRIEIRCDPLNVASRRVAEKSGYELDALFKNDCLAANGVGLRDTLVFSIVR